MAVHLTLVLARARNGVIGRGDALPWRLKTDMVRFRGLTLGKPVIMGRKTWQGLPKRPLPGRTNIVLSRDGSFEAAGALICENFTEAAAIGREQAAEDGVDEVCVIGGAEVFAIALPKARRICLTEVDGEPEGDVLLPPLDEADWIEKAREVHPAGPEDEFQTIFRVLERR